MKKRDKNYGVFKAYLVEIKDRWFSSSKRILKTIGVLLIPFLYAFTLIASFWNPLAKVGSIPIALCSLDKEQMILEDLDTSNINPNKHVTIGIPEYYTTDTSPSTDDWTEIPANVLVSSDSWDIWGSQQTTPITYIKTIGSSILNYGHTNKINGIANPNGSCNVQSLIDNVMKNWQNGSMHTNGFDYQPSNNTFSIKGQLSYPVTNIKYHTIVNTDVLTNWDQNASELANWDDQKQQWNIKNTNDYAQITIPTNITKDLISTLDASISQKDDPYSYLIDIQNKPINLYVTFEKTYLASKLADESIQILTSLISNSLPLIGTTIIDSIIKSIDNNISQFVNDNISEKWNGCYSWTPAENVNIPTLTWSDHLYQNDANGFAAITEVQPINLISGQKYTISNEEYRQALINDATIPSSVKIQLSAKRTSDNTYVIPSIEGITNDTTNHTWNPDTDTTGGTQHSLLHRVRNITSTLVEIPAIANVIAETINFCANTNLDKIFGELTDKILSVDVNEGNVINLFSSDQFLCGLFLQDSRFIIDDIKAPIIPIVAISSSVDIGTNFNFGRLLAVMAHTGEVDQTAYSNIFQTYNLRSSYSADSTNYETSGVSYHKGNILDDILPRATKNYDYAINDVTLLSTNNDYALSSNLDNNAHAILLALNSIYTPFNLNNYVSYTEIGHEYDFYGMGIGQYFICIGLCVGTLTQTMIYDKKKRFNKIKATKWYMSKTLLMFSTSLIQSTLLALAIGCVGWFNLGSAFVLQWLFMMFSGLIFVCIIQGIWFSFRDRSMAFFAIVIFMVLNISAGWGTFPAFMQFPFFHYVSYILPFTYMIHAQGAIVYGIGTNTHVFANALYVLQNVGILLIYVIIFGVLGLFMSRRRERELYYGTWNKYHLGIVLNELGYKKYCRITKKGPVVNWTIIPHIEMKDVKHEINLRYPYEKIFKHRRSKELVRDVVDFDNN